MNKIHLIYISVLIFFILVFSFFIIKKSEIVVISEQKSPYDHIKEQDIKVFKSKVELKVDNIIWSKFADTHSMEPVLAKDANGLYTTPKSEEDVHVGDIVSYNPDLLGYGDKLIIHRVIKVDNDDNGWYAIIKGDNLSEPDPGKIRFNQIKRLLIGIIY